MRILSILLAGMVGVFVAEGCGMAQRCTVIENPFYGLPGESRFVVEDNSTSVPTGKNRLEWSRTRYPGGVVANNPKFVKIAPQYVPARWNPMLIRKQIANIDLRIAESTGDYRRRLLDRKSEMEAILSMVDAEIARSPMVTK